MVGGSRLRPGLYGLLLGSVVASVAVQGAVPPGPVQQVVVSVLLGANLLLAVLVARASPRVLLLAALLAVAGVVLNLAHALTGEVGGGEVRLMNAAVALFGPPAVALGVIRTLRTSREVRVEAVSGVLSLYMLIGLLFAFVYGAVDRLGGAPFFVDGTPATVASCLYFSFTTLTTVGYLVTVVSLIVSNLGRRNGSAGRDAVA